jgi:hypothetical protein
MISDLNIDWYNLTKADMYTIIRQIEEENAKLRELVNGWNFCSKTKSSTSDDCVGCPLFIQTPHSYRCTRDERMRELEVKGNYK